MMHDISLAGLANHFVNQGLLDFATVSNALQQAKNSKLSLVSYLVKNNILASETILSACQKIYDLPIFDLVNYNKSWLETSPLESDFIQNYRVIPLDKTNNTLQIGIADPDKQTIDAVALRTGLRICPMLVAEDKLVEFLNRHFGEHEANSNLQRKLLKKISLEENIFAVNENVINYDEPLIQFVDNIILHASQQAVSDIHIEPYETICRIRYRQHGVLYEVDKIPNSLANRISTRLKVMAKLDISERRLPQDGRLQANGTDLRINICPTLFGEKIALRLLNTTTQSLEIDQLGMTDAQQILFHQYIGQPQGMILVTGPTGSGKTVTLYSALNYLNKNEKNISTVEDPVEIRLNGINQVNINAKIGLQFSTVLRALLRQDPDIIMVGEIRDPETAEIAIKAAQTGHLVLSTLHTNSAVETISRLRSMGVLSYNIANTVSLIIAQRLIRKLCEYCKKPEFMTEKTLLQLGLIADEKHIFYRAEGCSQCTQGYKNRIAIYEFLPLTEHITKLIALESDSFTIQKIAKIVTLKQIGLEKVLQGETSLLELNRVLQ